jgi:hypothetical protein
MKALWGLFVERSMVGDYAVGATVARRFAAVAEQLNLPTSLGGRLLGLALHHCGEHSEARLHVERVIRIARLTPQVPRSSGFGYDDRTAAGTQLSRILWIQGFADQAAMAARDVIADAMSQDHAPSVCFALVWPRALSLSGAGIVTLADDMSTYYWSTRTRIPWPFGVTGAAVSISFGSGDTQPCVPLRQAFCAALRCRRQVRFARNS